MSGCDTDPTGAADLAALGVRIAQGHDPAHLAGVRAVVVTAAVRPGHPELERARELGLPIVPRKVALAELIEGARAVAVSGTHGKTTTTVMTTEALTAAGLNPTGIAGGRVSSWGGNARVAGDDLFVVEADEYDKAFLTLYPTVAVVNNVEPDHLECYGSMAALERRLRGVRRPGVGSPSSTPTTRERGEVASRVGTSVRRFGCAADADIRISDVVQQADRTEARIAVEGWPFHPASTARCPVFTTCGMRWRRWLRWMRSVARSSRPPRALGDFQGVGRRFERLGEFGGVAVVDDYAHHPSELAATLSAARQAFPGPAAGGGLPAAPLLAHRRARSGDG